MILCLNQHFYRLPYQDKVHYHSQNHAVDVVCSNTLQEPELIIIPYISLEASSFKVSSAIDNHAMAMETLIQPRIEINC